MLRLLESGTAAEWVRKGSRLRGSLDFGFEAEGVERWLVGVIDLKTDALRMRNLDHTNVGRASKGWKPRMDRSGDFCRERVR